MNDEDPKNQHCFEIACGERCFSAARAAAFSSRRFANFASSSSNGGGEPKPTPAAHASDVAF
jgi:hypothetical protein